jgi:hypothetical protein
MSIVLLSNEKFNIEKYIFFSIRKILYFINLVKGKGKVTPKQAYVALRGPGG